MAKVFTIPVPPDLGRKKRERTSDPRYVDGQRLLVEAMRYLAQTDPITNRSAIELLSEHVRLVIGSVCARYLIDRKSTRLNSSHSSISYAVFCLKKKKMNRI